MAEQYEMPEAEAEARAKLARLTTYELVLSWEELMKYRPTSATVVVRTMLMDELEKRNARAYNSWLDSNEISPRKFFAV